MRRSAARTARPERVTAPLTPAEEAELAGARARGYVVFRGSWGRVASAWWAWCRAHAHPFVAVRLWGRHAGVTVDMLHVRSKLTRLAVARFWARLSSGDGWRHTPIPDEEAELLRRERWEVRGVDYVTACEVAGAFLAAAGRSSGWPADGVPSTQRPCATNAAALSIRRIRTLSGVPGNMDRNS